MKNDTFVIGVIVVIILFLLTTGCTTTKEVSEANYQLLPSPSGLIRFNENTGQTDFLIQTPAGMRWMKVQEGEVELIPVPVPQHSSMPRAQFDIH